MENDNGMTLDEAVKYCWNKYQKFVLKQAWGELYKEGITQKERESQARQALEYHQLYEWLYKLKRIAKAVSDYENGIYESPETTLDVILTILEEGEGT